MLSTFTAVSITVCNTQPCRSHDFDRGRDSSLQRCEMYTREGRIELQQLKKKGGKKKKRKEKFSKKIIAILICLEPRSMPNYQGPCRRVIAHSLGLNDDRGTKAGQKKP